MRVFIRATEFLANDDDVADDAYRFFELGPSDDDRDNGDDGASHGDGYCTCLFEGGDTASSDDGYRARDYDSDNTASHDDGYRAHDEDAVSFDGGYCACEDYDDDLPSHALDTYDQTFGDSHNNSTDCDDYNAVEDSVIRYDDYSADRGDSITVYDNTFYTAANRSPTPHPTPRPQFRQFKERENHRAENRNTAILFPETLECRPSAVASRALTRQVFDTEETDPADGYYMGQAAISGPKTFREAMASPQSAKWKEAVAAELESIDNNDVMEVVPRQGGMHVLTTRWVFVTKQLADGAGPLYKGRLIAVRIVKLFTSSCLVGYHMT